MIFLKELCFLLLFLAGFCTGDDNELKLNMVGFTSTPAVQNSKKTIIRGYTLGSDRSDNITLSIDWLDNIGHLSGNQLCNNSNASEFAYVECNLVNTDFAKYRQATISCSNSGCTDNARIGVFTAYVEKDTRIATATIIVHHNNAYVKPIVRAKTVNAGDSKVTLGVKKFNGSENNLRWAKDGTSDSKWDGLKKIIFDTITV
ncbi:uncharacterized protein LOC117100344 [Anneissia japonica]|uniref:uncharacterized protein LOC117100344 n=1 Tax=Anneissia japonica TaxID=1529436 RepID=UPI00142577F7|nr:uncharacterized protein LOC117100344 [Anneissia japonica]